VPNPTADHLVVTKLNQVPIQKKDKVIKKPSKPEEPVSLKLKRSKQNIDAAIRSAKSSKKKLYRSFFFGDASSPVHSGFILVNYNDPIVGKPRPSPCLYILMKGSQLQVKLPKSHFIVKKGDHFVIPRGVSMEMSTESRTGCVVSFFCVSDKVFSQTSSSSLSQSLPAEEDA